MNITFYILQINYKPTNKRLLSFQCYCRNITINASLATFLKYHPVIPVHAHHQQDLLVQCGFCSTQKQALRHLAAECLKPDNALNIIKH